MGKILENKDLNTNGLEHEHLKNDTAIPDEKQEYLNEKEDRNTNYLINAFKEAKEIIQNELEETEDYKNELLKITESFLSKLAGFYITDLVLYSVDEDTLAINFKSQGILCDVELFYYPEEQTEYLATVEKNGKALLNQISDRNDFDDITKFLNTITSTFIHKQENTHTTDL